MAAKKTSAKKTDFAVRDQSGNGPGPARAATELAEITDEEIDNLLSS